MTIYRIREAKRGLLSPGSWITREGRRAIEGLACD